MKILTSILTGAVWLLIVSLLAAPLAIIWQISQRDGTGLTLLLDKLTPVEAVLHSACEQARREGNTEALALLLERQRKSKPRGFDRDFDL